MSHLSSVLKGVVGLSALLSFASYGLQHAVMRDDFGFKVMDQGEWPQVHNYDVEPKLRNMNREHLKKFLAAGCLIKAKQLKNGDFALRSKVPGKGGGLGGAAAGVAVGHFFGNMVVFTGIGVVSTGAGAIAFCVGGPWAAGVVAGATAKSLAATVVPLAQPFIHAMAISGGIAGGVATGPV